MTSIQDAIITTFVIIALVFGILSLFDKGDKL